MKRGPLSNEDKEYITKNLNKKDIIFFVKKLQRSESLVSKFIESLQEKPTEQVEANEAKIKTMDVSDLFAKNKSRGVTIMTENASMVSDTNKQSRSPSSVDRMKNCVRTIK